MLTINEYFEGRVRSIGFSTEDGPATVGVMTPGEYTFGTSTIEYMTVTSGLMSILLPNETEWRDYREFETFKVEKDVKFKVRVAEETSYRCLYQ